MLKTGSNKLKAKFVSYGDFECLSTETSEGRKRDVTKSQTSGYMLHLVNACSGETKPYLYRGGADKFCEAFQQY